MDGGQNSPHVQLLFPASFFFPDSFENRFPTTGKALIRNSGLYLWPLFPIETTERLADFLSNECPRCVAYGMGFLGLAGVFTLLWAYLSQGLTESLFLHCNRPPKAFPQHQYTFRLGFVHPSPACKHFCGWLWLKTKPKTQRDSTPLNNTDTQTESSQANYKY